MFSTAGGRQLSVSAGALERAKALLQADGDVEMEELHDGEGEKEQRSDVTESLFATAGGRKLTVSKAAVARAQSLLGDDDREADEKSSATEEATISAGLKGVKRKASGSEASGFSMFSTAGGRALRVSEKALKQAAHLLEDDSTEREISDGSMDAEDGPLPAAMPSGLPTFATARGTPVTIDADAVEKAKRFLASEDFGSQGSSSGEAAPLFSTAGGRPVRPSAAALRKAQGILSEFGGGEDDSQGSSAGEAVSLFSTAGGRPVQPSAAALNKAQGILSEIGDLELTAWAQAADEHESQSPVALARRTPTKSVPVGQQLHPRARAEHRSPASNSPTSPVAVSSRRSRLGSAISSRVGQKRYRSPLKQVSSPNEAGQQPTPLSRDHQATPTKKQRFSYSGAATKPPVTPSPPGALKAGAAQISRSLPKPSRLASTPRRFKAPRQTRQPLTPLRATKAAERVPDVALFQLDADVPRTPLTDLSRPEVHSRHELELVYGLPATVLDMTLSSAPAFRFPSCSSTVPELALFDSVGWEEIQQALVAVGAKERYFPDGWTKNHYGQVVWKLATMERTYPDSFAGQYLTVERVLSQMKYRYEREINRGKVPAIRQVLEKDQMPSKHMVLCVSALVSSGSAAVYGEAKEAATKDGRGAEVEVTDGWYSIGAILDDDLTIAMQKGLLFVGQKLHIFGARLTSTEATTPLENSTVKLLLAVNGTRRAKWHEKLGFHQSLCVSTSLASVKATGGLVPAVDVVVERRYPLLFLETVSEGIRVTRNSADELAAARTFEQSRGSLLDRKRKLIEQRIARRHSAAAKKYSSLARSGSKHLATVTDPEMLYHAVHGSSDPGATFSVLSRDQQRAVKSYSEDRNISVAQEVSNSLQEFVQSDRHMQRKVTAFVRILVRDSPPFETAHRGTALVTIWGATPELLPELAEGKRLRLCGLTPSAWQKSGQPLQLSVNKSGMRLVPLASEGLPYKATQRGVCSIGELEGREEGRIFDTAAVLVHMGPASVNDPGRRDIPRRILYFVDEAGQVLLVELVGQRFALKLHGDCVALALANVSYLRFDRTLGLHVAVCNEGAVVSASSGISALAERVVALKAWCQTSQAADVIDSARKCSLAVESGERPVRAGADEMVEDEDLLKVLELVELERQAAPVACK